MECEYRLNGTEFDSVTKMSKGTLVRDPLVFALPMLTVSVWNCSYIDVFNFRKDAPWKHEGHFG